MKKILVAGATGIAGSTTVRHFAGRPDYEVIALSRRKIANGDNVSHLSVDLTDRDGCIDALRKTSGITHLAYMALQEEDNLLEGWRSEQQMSSNLSMLRNLLDGIAQSDSTLRHVTTLQGGKAYGSHLGNVPVPAKERWPRLDHKIFYWQQEDLLNERQKAEGWGLTILRPMRILGDALGSPMNIIAAMGVYASVMREQGRPLRFPGGEPYVTACTDSRMIAEAVEFAAENPVAHGETYNVVNGDVMVWKDFWPALARHFNMPIGDPEPMQLASEMPHHARTWADIARKHDLREPSMEAFVGKSWQFADYGFAYAKAAPRVLMSPIKLRKAGFSTCYDTEDSILYWIGRLQEAGMLPK